MIGRNEPRSFIRDLHADWHHHYQVDVFKEQTTRSPFFKERLNRRMLQDDLAQFMTQHDVVFFEWASELLAVASHLPKRTRIVARLHRYEMYSWVDRINWDAVDNVIFVGEAMRKQFAERFPQQATRTTVINSAINLSDFPFSHRPFRGIVGILSHITPRKRVYELVLTIYELINDGHQLQFRIGGAPSPAHLDYHRALRHLVNELDLSDHVHFDGPVHDQLAWYNEIDVFISNSYSEGLQLAPIEAMSTGRVCFAHRWEGAEELLPDSYLYYTDSELRDCLVRYIQMSDAERLVLQNEMRSIVENRFHYGVTAPAIRSVIEAQWLS